MKKKTNKEIIEEVVIENEKPTITKIEGSFGNGELNILKDKINELIDYVS